jgi:hypothetical protein
MAKEAPAPQTDNGPIPLQLSPNDVIGAVQRMIRELDNYLWAVPVSQIHPYVIMATLERAAQFANTLPVPADAETGNGQQDRKAG